MNIGIVGSRNIGVAAARLGPRLGGKRRISNSD
jgi:hypothetical protein